MKYGGGAGSNKYVNATNYCSVHINLNFLF